MKPGRESYQSVIKHIPNLSSSIAVNDEHDTAIMQAPPSLMFMISFTAAAKAAGLRKSIPNGL